MKSAIFIERDGILNQTATVRQGPSVPLTFQEFQIMDSAVPVFQKLKSSGFLLIVTTNQPGLSNGSLNRREMDRMHDVLSKRFPVDDILVCPHDSDDDCACRKPGTGLFTEAAFKHHLDLERCYVVSDKWQDARAARHIGAVSLLLESPWVGNGHKDLVLPTLPDIASKILKLESRYLAV